ncbi:MAG: ABC-F type ribosomal protection protein [Caldilineaceae bacterium]|nr:ABC-F type ribosomal protection protein [Caldilineaceae bacterium]
MLLSLSNISKFYGEKQVLKDVSFSLYPGDHVGLVGANGAGKSTLLKVIVGNVAPDGGHVTAAHNIEIGYLPQTLADAAEKSVDDLLQESLRSLRQLEAQMRDLEGRMTHANGALDAILADYTEISERFERRGGYDLDYRLEIVLSGLAVADIDRSRRVSTLSGGEKTRICLAALLLCAPDLLLLDEPTNHLDFAALEWLEAYLHDYGGGMLVVSHDRHFLNGTVTSLLEVDEHTGQVKSYTGNYDAYAEVKALERIKWAAAYDQQQEEIHELRQIIKGKARQVAHNRAPRDGDKYVKHFKRERVETAIARNVSAAEERLRRLEADPIPEPPQRLIINPNFNPQTLTSASPLTASQLRKAYGDEIVLDDVTFALSASSRVVIVGPNGAGKSTLLRILAGIDSADQGEVTRAGSVIIGYLDQEQETLDPSLTLFEVYRQGLTGHFEEIKAALLRYHLFTWPDLMKKVGALSIGQKRKLQIARLMAVGANLLLLDEPTNHISFDVLEEFEAALLDFPGPVLAVSHDRRFIQRFADEIWEVRDGKLIRYPGGWEVYREVTGGRIA